MKNNLPVSWAVALSLVGMKCAILLNQSTTTMMALKPLDGGKPTMKSMDTFSHGLLGIGNGYNNPACFFVKHLILLASQASLHILLHTVFQVGPIVGPLEECYGALCTTMACKRSVMTFLQDGILHLPLWDIKLILLIPQ
jgi:hypothetical protein